MFNNAMNKYGALPGGVQTETFLQDAQTHLTAFKKQAKVFAAAAHTGEGNSERETEQLAIATTERLINLIHQSPLSVHTKRFLLQRLAKQSEREYTSKKK
jgi:hypothetical protein